jgi:hypothetical protein
MSEKIEEDVGAVFREFAKFGPSRTRPDDDSLELNTTRGSDDADHSPTEDEDWVDGNVTDEDNSQSDLDLLPFSRFGTIPAGPLVAVDCGCKRLGETTHGLVIALRAAVIIDDGGSTTAKLYRTGPLYLPYHLKAQVLHLIGTRLGEPDYYVTLDDADPPRPLRAKGGVADKAVQYTDRFRAFLERLAQKFAVTAVQKGTILFDGALTLRTRDCPDSYLRGLASRASGHGNSIIAVSKTSELLVQGKSVRFWLNDAAPGACYRDLTPLIRKGKTVQARGWGERVMGNVYSARFSMLGPTFRIDVKATRGATDREALNQFFSSARMRCGYPEILVRAHALSYFSSEAVMQLQAQACAKFGLRPQSDVSLSATFSPFGGRFK